MTFVDSQTVIEWGQTKEDVDYIENVLTQIQEAAARARSATTSADGRTALAVDLRGAATLLGQLVPVDQDPIATLRAFLLGSRDYEGEVSERIIRAANGKSEDERRAARLAALPHSGRRGWLDSTVYAIDQALSSLETLRAWEERQ